MDARIITIDQASTEILAKRAAMSHDRSLLAGLSGIDGSGKGYLTGRIVEQLQQRGVHAVGINDDGWLNLPHVRFCQNHPAEHFYAHAIRFDDMFAQLILPLRAHRSHDVVIDLAEETAREFRPYRYRFDNVDIIVLEGIYLLKHAYRGYFDLALWVDCTFETALERALSRGQEGLPPDATTHAYRTIYFPAQQIHFERDAPRTSADYIILNDPRLGDAGRQMIEPAGHPPSVISEVPR